jgi:hypothetical protein
MGFGECLAALAATEPAQAVSVRAKAGATDFARRAVHGDLYFGFGFRFHIFIIHQAVDVLQEKMR